MKDDIDRLSKLFLEFPGIGERQSRRFVYALLSKNQEYIDSLSENIKKLKQRIAQCRSCYRYFPADGYDECPECTSPETDKSLLLVIEKDSDFEAVRRSKLYKGHYFVLGGLVPIVEKSTPDKVRINELVSQVKKQAPNGLKEIIIALSLTPQGENTDRYVRESIEPIVAQNGIKVSNLGRGFSTGSELEYSDQDTIKNALENRK